MPTTRETILAALHARQHADRPIAECPRTGSGHAWIQRCLVAQIGHAEHLHRQRDEKTGLVLLKP